MRSFPSRLAATALLPLAALYAATGDAALSVLAWAWFGCMALLVTVAGALAGKAI